MVEITGVDAREQSLCFLQKDFFFGFHRKTSSRLEMQSLLNQMFRYMKRVFLF